MQNKPEPAAEWDLACIPEYSFGMSGTKWRIFCCAVHYFAEYDYSSISMRQLADSVGIRAASIYNHFPSKEAILTVMYRYMRMHAERFLPDLDDLLLLAETEAPRAVMERTHFEYPEPLQSLMSKMILICSKLMRSDATADEMLRFMLIDTPRRYMQALLAKMIDSGRIRPLDTEAFTELYIDILYGASLRMYSSHPVKNEVWYAAFSMLFDVLEPLE